MACSYFLKISLPPIFHDLGTETRELLEGRDCVFLINAGHVHQSSPFEKKGKLGTLATVGFGQEHSIHCCACGAVDTGSELSKLVQ